MKFIDDLFLKYEVRKNKKQKEQFINWVIELAQDKGYNVTVEKGAFGSRNVVIGDIDKAKVVFTAHYDTCANMFIPNFITPKNIFVYLLYQVLVVGLIFGVGFLGAFGIGFLIPTLEDFVPLFSEIFIFGLLIMMIAGPANKHTANDNTSGVATVLGIMEKLPKDKRDEVLFVLFDFEEAGLIGSSAFASKHKEVMKDKLLVNFDCVSDGERMLFVLNKKTKDLSGVFNEAYSSNESVNTEVVSKGVFYPSDQVCFEKGVGVCSMKFNKLFKSGYIDRLHTKRDTIFRKENIEFLVDGSIKLIDLINNK